MYIHTETHNVGHIKHGWGLEIKWLSLHWLSGPAQFRQWRLHLWAQPCPVPQPLLTRLSPVGSLIARAMFRIRCGLGESKLQPTLNSWFISSVPASQLLRLSFPLSTCPDTPMIRLTQNMTQRNVTNYAFIYCSIIITFHAEFLFSPSSKKTKEK